jgi:transposase-like protein
MTLIGKGRKSEGKGGHKAPMSSAISKDIVQASWTLSAILHGMVSMHCPDCDSADVQEVAVKEGLCLVVYRCSRCQTQFMRSEEREFSGRLQRRVERDERPPR